MKKFLSALTAAAVLALPLAVISTPAAAQAPAATSVPAATSTPAVKSKAKAAKVKHSKAKHKSHAAKKTV